jgi:hypothetical protein
MPGEIKKYIISFLIIFFIVSFDCPSKASIEIVTRPVQPLERTVQGLNLQVPVLVATNLLCPGCVEASISSWFVKTAIAKDSHQIKKEREAWKEGRMKRKLTRQIGKAFAFAALILFCWGVYWVIRKTFYGAGYASGVIEHHIKSSASNKESLKRTGPEQSTEKNDNNKNNQSEKPPPYNWPKIQEIYKKLIAVSDPNRTISNSRLPENLVKLHDINNISIAHTCLQEYNYRKLALLLTMDAPINIFMGIMGDKAPASPNEGEIEVLKNNLEELIHSIGGPNNIYLLTRMFFGSDLKEEKSLFLEEKMRVLYFPLFIKFLEENKIDIESQKDRYSKEFPHHTLMPCLDLLQLEEASKGRTVDSNQSAVRSEGLNSSKESKLTEAKSLLSKGLINERDYEALKKKVLGIDI